MRWKDFRKLPVGSVVWFLQVDGQLSSWEIIGHDEPRGTVVKGKQSLNRNGRITPNNILVVFPSKAAATLILTASRLTGIDPYVLLNSNDFLHDTKVVEEQQTMKHKP